MMAGRVVVDVVADPPLLVPYLDELVLVEPAPEPGDPRASEPLAGQIRRVDVEDSSRRKALERYLHQACREISGGIEVEPIVEWYGLLDRLVPGAVYAKRDCDARDPDHYPLHRTGDRPRIGDVVAEVLPVVYPRDDDVWLEVHEPEGDEPHAIDRRPRAGVSGHPIRHLALLYVDRAPEGDAPAHPRTVPIRGHGDDVPDLLQGTPSRQKPRSLDPIIVGQYYAHSPKLVAVRKGSDSITLASMTPAPHRRSGVIRYRNGLSATLRKKNGQIRPYTVAYRGCDGETYVRSVMPWTP